MASSTTNLTTLRINYLSSQQYQDALDGGSIDENQLYLTPASGRGSSVSAEQILTSGTAVAKIIIDGVEYTLYAPTPPTKLSQLTNDGNYVVDSAYVHTDNNFTTALKNKLTNIAAGAEVNVQANWNEASSSSDAYIQNKPFTVTKTTTAGETTYDIEFI